MTSVFSNIGSGPKAQENKTAPVKQNEAAASMKLKKPAVSIANPPQDIYKPSLSKDVQKRVETHKNNLIPTQTKSSPVKKNNNSNVLAASSLQRENRSFAGSVIRTLLLLGGIVGGGYLLVRKIKFSKISEIGITTLDDIKKSVNDITEIAKKRRIRSKDLKNVTVRVIDEEPNKIKEILQSICKLTRETRNIEGQTPQIFIKLGNESNEAAKAIQEALKKEGVGISGLTDDVLNKVDYVNLRYLPNVDKNNNTILNTIVSNMKASKINQAGEIKNKWLEGLFGSS